MTSIWNYSAKLKEAELYAEQGFLQKARTILAQIPEKIPSAARRADYYKRWAMLEETYGSAEQVIPVLENGQEADAQPAAILSEYLQEWIERRKDEKVDDGESDEDDENEDENECPSTPKQSGTGTTTRPPRTPLLTPSKLRGMTPLRVKNEAYDAEKAARVKQEKELAKSGSTVIMTPVRVTGKKQQGALGASVTLTPVRRSRRLGSEHDSEKERERERDGEIQIVDDLLSATDYAYRPNHGLVVADTDFVSKHTLEQRAREKAWAERTPQTTPQKTPVKTPTRAFRMRGPGLLGTPQSARRCTDSPTLHLRTGPQRVKLPVQDTATGDAEVKETVSLLTPSKMRLMKDSAPASTFLSPVKLSRKQRDRLGVEYAVTPLRRSARTPQKTPKAGDSDVQNMLEQSAYTYIPHPNFCPEDPEEAEHAVQTVKSVHWSAELQAAE